MKISQLIYSNNDSGDCYAGLFGTSVLMKEFLRLSFEQVFDSQATFFDSNNSGNLNKELSADYVVLTDGRYLAQIDDCVLKKTIASSSADVICFSVNSHLGAYSETPRLTSENTIAGFCRLYDNVSLKLLSPPENCHHIFVKPQALHKICRDEKMPVNFSQAFENVCSNQVDVEFINLPGSVFDLTCQEGLYEIFDRHFKTLYPRLGKFRKFTKPENVKIFGDVLVEDTARIENGSIIIGPAIICEDAKISEGALVKASIVSPNAEVLPNSHINNTILVNDKTQPEQNNHYLSSASYSCKGYRRWPIYSYPRLGKRIFDIIFSSVMILLFLPIIPIIIIAIKINSPGPIFFKTKRQGLNGKDFNCLKFRSMMIGAEQMQSTLRMKNEVDGPQFKIADDPRISSVGAFLRDTSLDEIPQFFNVLMGQMSIVGPRPSPENENLKCPYWRDARLSVKPGITGLWQIKRTREPAKDFQEWVHFDTKYVRDISFKLDLTICFKTALMLIKDFLNKF